MTRFSCLLLLFFFWILIPYSIKAQLSILNSGVSEFNITPKGLLEVSVMNPQHDVEVILEGKIFNSQNEVIMDVTSNPFLLKKGMNNTAQLNVSIASVNYSSNEQASYIKTSHILPSGKFRYCLFIKSLVLDITSDEYCNEFESELSTFLFLVFPPDKDEIETKNPLLIWTHSESFSLNSPTNYYKIVVTDLNPDQSPEAAINTNVPVYLKNFLTSHSVQYPVDAKELISGKNYAWQVQQISNGNIVNKTEAWQFKLKAPQAVNEIKFITVKKTLGGGYYMASNNKIFFRFDESYGTKDVHYKIFNEKREVVSVNNGKKNELKTTKIGYNEFEIDLKPFDLKSGMYTLEVTNDKKEVFLLKFLAE